MRDGIERMTLERAIAGRNLDQGTFGDLVAGGATVLVFLRHWG